MGISLGEALDALDRAVDGVGDFVVDAGNRAIDLVTGYDIAEHFRVRGEQERGNDLRDGIHGRQSELEPRITTGWDREVVVEESFDSMSHEAIMASVERMDPAALNASAEGWTAIGDALANGLEEFKTAILGAIGAGWSGDAADAAARATDAYVTASDELSAAGSLIGTKVAEAATGIQQVKATVPPPEHTSLLENLFNAASPPLALIKTAFHERDEARQQAVQIMKTVYSPVMREADTRVPTLPAPLSVTVDGASDGTTQGGGNGGGGGGSGQVPWYLDGNNQSNAYTPADTATTPGETGGASPGENPGADSGVDGSGFDGSGGAGDGSGGAETAGGVGSNDAAPDPASVWTRPAGVGTDGVVPGTSGTGPGSSGSSVLGSGGAGSSVHGVGSGGSGIGSGGSGFGGAGGGMSGGSGIVAAPGTVAAAGGSAGAPSGAGAAGRPGMPGMGMAPAAARGGSDSDSEHETPGYLVNADNGSELVGTLPLVAPPVLGA